MILFELVHTYYTWGTDIYYSLRTLGFYTSKQAADDAIAYYRTKVGYKDSPNGFSIRRRNVIGEIKNNTLFEAMVYAHTEDYEGYEYTAELGLYASKVDAENAVNIYCADNKIFAKNKLFEIEEIVNRRIVNKHYCEEGFVVESIT